MNCKTIGFLALTFINIIPNLSFAHIVASVQKLQNSMLFRKCVPNG